MVDMLSKEWTTGVMVAKFNVNTAGPEGCWDVEMRACTSTSDGKRYNVVYDPFADRLMWFDSLLDARQAFTSLVQLAMFDADDGDTRKENGK